jgi:hypothetical protein
MNLGALAALVGQAFSLRRGLQPASNEPTNPRKMHRISQRPAKGGRRLNAYPTRPAKVSKGLEAKPKIIKRK